MVVVVVVVMVVVIAVLVTFQREKNSAYGRHRIYGHVRIVAPIPKRTETDRKRKKKIICHMSGVRCDMPHATCHASRVTCHQ